MAAVRQFFNARAVGIGGMAAKDDNAPSDDTQRKIEAKMQAMGYSISPPIPNESLSIRNLDEQNGTRQLHSKFSDAQTHPLHRKQSVEGVYNRTNSLDQANFRPQAPQRSTTDTLLQNGLAAQDRQMEDRSSFYEDGEHSPALSPALNKHLALRPLDTAAQQQQSYSKGHQRRRSRSATDDSQNYNDKNLWDNYAKDRKHKPRQESLRGAPKALATNESNDNSSRTMQMLRDRQNNLGNDNVRLSACFILFLQNANIGSRRLEQIQPTPHRPLPRRRHKRSPQLQQPYRLYQQQHQQ